MRIQSPPQSATLSLPRQAATEGLQVGQLVRALVVSQPQAGRALLQLQSSLLEVETLLTLRPGQQLQLKVEAEPNGQLRLRILSAEAERADTPLAQNLRHTLPRQAPLQPLFNHLARLAQLPPPELEAELAPPRPGQPTAGGGQAAEGGRTVGEGQAATQREMSAPFLREAVQRLWQALPTPRSLSQAEGLQQALRHSGLFLEHHLARGDAPALSRDLKANLLRLLAVLQRQEGVPGKQGAAPQSAATAQSSPPPTPPGPTLPATLQLLLQQSEEGLARLQLNQLQSVPQQQGEEQTLWLFELPLRQDKEGELLQLRIQREGGAQEQEEEAAWSVNLAFEDQRYGTIHGRVNLRGASLRTTLWAEQKATAELMRRHLPRLHERLQAIGLEVGPLQCHTGLPADAADETVTFSNLVDTRA